MQTRTLKAIGVLVVILATATSAGVAGAAGSTGDPYSDIGFRGWGPRVGL